MEKKLKPVIFNSPSFRKKAFINNPTQQIILLKALSVTQDPSKLRQMMGVKTIAEVYRTLDRLAMRKEYHAALAKAGISFDYIVGGLKKVAENSFKDADKLNAYKTLLKSLGMDSYNEVATNDGNWEDALLKAVESGDKGFNKEDALAGEYEVKTPRLPDSVKQAQEEERDLNDSIYG